MTKKYVHSILMQVRDYECDIEGIVNNAIYLHYLEHARCEFMKKFGLNFHDLTKRGINLVVIKAEIDYKSPLRSGDEFFVTSNIEQISAFKFGFSQEILCSDKTGLIAKANITCAALDKRGKPLALDILQPMLKSS
jgi:acyl-CoA thioester hydrolase